jgi:hypothetical protein
MFNMPFASATRQKDIIDAHGGDERQINPAGKPLQDYNWL